MRYNYFILLLTCLFSSCQSHTQINDRYYLEAILPEKGQVLYYEAVKYEGLGQGVLSGDIKQVWYDDNWIVAKRIDNKTKELEYWILKIDMNLESARLEQVKFGPYNHVELATKLKNLSIHISGVDGYLKSMGIDSK